MAGMQFLGQEVVILCKHREEFIGSNNRIKVNYFIITNRVKIAMDSLKWFPALCVKFQRFQRAMVARLVG